MAHQINTSRIPAVSLAKIALTFLDSSSSSASTSNTTNQEWILNPTFRETRTFVGRSFAGTATVTGEPFFAWLLNHLNGVITTIEREELVRFIMSCFVAESIRKGGIVFARRQQPPQPQQQRSVADDDDDDDGTLSLASVVIVREYDAQREKSFWTQTIDAIYDTILTMRLAITDGMPAIFTNPKIKQSFRIAQQIGNDMVQNMKAHHMSLMPHNNKHWYIAIVGTEPDLQGTGQGSAMVKRIIQMADQAQADCYLEANGMDNKKFYEKFGFRAQTSFTVPNKWDPNDQDGDTIPTYCMIRRCTAL